MIPGVLIFLAYELALVAGTAVSVVCAVQALEDREYGWLAVLAATSLAMILVIIAGIPIAVKEFGG